ncbi:MAG: type II toxin-antitoxin system RelE/ParE family toxin [Pseudomonadales bacterium]|nr:type II toxin-antitoxin system RelE/ParE family toxin [Pseudomonadales bacterium]
MKAVHWTQKAKHRLRAIQETIEEDNPKAALEMVDAIIDKADQAGPLPLSGKVVPEYKREDLRELNEHPVMCEILNSGSNRKFIQFTTVRLPRIIIN